MNTNISLIDEGGTLRRDLQEYQDDGSTIDIMCIYTREAVCNEAIGQKLCDVEKYQYIIKDKCQLAVAETNTAYKESGADIRLRIVYSGPLNSDYSESFNFCSMTQDMSTSFIQTFKEVRQKRDEYGADLVALVVDNNNYCGCAYNYNGNSRNGFVTVNRECMTGYFSFAHEISHTLGCQHDRNHVTNGKGDYAYGYQDPEGKFRTIMSYDCPTNASCLRVQRFSTSNPIFKYEGKPIGSNREDNVRQINEVALTVANFRQSSQSSSMHPSTYPTQGPSSTSTTMSNNSTNHASFAPSTNPTQRPSSTPTSKIESCPDGKFLLQMNWHTDSNPSETVWKLKDWQNQNLIHEGTYNLPNTSFQNSFCLNLGGCYKVIIIDNAGDGFDSDGYYSVSVDGVIIGDQGVGAFEWKQHTISNDSPPKANEFRLTKGGAKYDCEWLKASEWRVNRFCLWNNIKTRCPYTCKSCKFFGNNMKY